MQWKRAIVYCLCFLLMTATLSVPGAAAALSDTAEPGKEPVLHFTEQYLDDTESRTPTAAQEAAAPLSVREQVSVMHELCADIREALLAGESSVSLSALDISTTNQQFRHIGYYCPYFDGVDITGTLYYSGSGIYTRLVLSNTLTAEETADRIARVDSAYAEIEEILRQEEYTLYDRILQLHDFMCAHYHYDTTYQQYYPGVMALEGYGVCQSYAYLFQYLMVDMGYECYTTTSSAMQHAWNIVKVNGSYYQLDITWDDPIQDRYGQANHNYFLLSDAAMSDSSHNHSGWDLTELTCTDTTFENAFYIGASTPVAMEGAVRYYGSWSAEAGEAVLYRLDTDSGELTIAAKLGRWTSWGSASFYSYAYSGLFCREGKLYFNTKEAVMTYDLQTGELAEFARPDTADGWIYGILEEGCTVNWACQQVPTVAYSDKDLRTLDLPHSYVLQRTECTDCEAGGTLYYRCPVCGDEKTEAADPAAHVLQVIDRVYPSQWETGLESCRCLICGTAVSRELPVAGSDYYGYDAAKAEYTGIGADGLEYSFGLQWDVNLDGQVSLQDVSVLYRAYCGRISLSAEALSRCETAEADGRLTLVDAAALYRLWSSYDG